MWICQVLNLNTIGFQSGATRTITNAKALWRQLELSNNFGQMEFDCLLLRCMLLLSQLHQHTKVGLSSQFSLMTGKQRFFPASLQKSTYLDSFSRLMILFCKTRKFWERNSFILKCVILHEFQNIFFKYSILIHSKSSKNYIFEIKKNQHFCLKYFHC